MSITVTTNNVPRPVIYAWELTPAERAEFDYLDWDAIEAGNDSASFFRYRGQLYDLSDGFEYRIPEGTPGRWDGFQSDSFFSGIVIRYSEDFEYVTVGTLIA
jgi:hypothetical protein